MRHSIRTGHWSISIHALREEGDEKTPCLCYTWGAFLSTPSARRATEARETYGIAYLISIHALREEGDRKIKRQIPQNFNFYPRPPRGGRPSEAEDFIKGAIISIHALREEGDALFAYR